MLRFATPSYVLAFVSVAFIWREICKRLDGRVARGVRGTIVPVWARYYSLLAVVITWLMFASLHCMVREVLIDTPLLDPDKIEAAVQELMRRDEDDVNTTLGEWREEAALRGYPCLRLLSLAAPLFLIATYVNVFLHIARHLIWMQRSGGFNLGDPEASQRDKVVRILVLPLIYGLMCFQGVLRMWGVTTNYVTGDQHFANWGERRSFLKDASDGAVMVADLYEAYALFVFGTVVIKVLKQQIDERIRTAELEAETSLLASDSRDGAGIKNPRAAPKLMLLVESVSELLQETKNLTMLGIKLFCITCGTQALFTVAVNALSFYGLGKEYFGAESDHGHGEVGVLQTEEFKSSWTLFCSGAGFMASFAAIGNILSLEHGFNAYLQGFHTYLKFLGTKILVTIAFIQQVILVVLPPFSKWTGTRVRLFYTSVLTLECFIISVTHIWAWPPDEKWYSSTLLATDLLLENDDDSSDEDDASDTS